MSRKKNYNVDPFFTGPVIAALMLLAIAIPVLLTGLAVFGKLVSLLFFTDFGAGIPVWAIILIGLAFIVILKRR